MRKTVLRIVAAVALLAYLVSYIPSAALPAEAAVSTWQKGVTIMPTSTGDFGSDSFKQSVRNAESMGANYVTLVIPYYQSNQYSTDIGSGWNTPTDTSLASGIDFIHSLGMHVMLKVHLENYSGAWRAYIDPGDRTTWFRNYGTMLNHLADIGKAHGVEGICIGAELISMATYTSHSDNTQQWVTMINAVRSRYSGFLTYSANWGNTGFVEEVPHISFWPNLDFIGISAYYELSGDNSVNNLVSQWNNWYTNRIKPIHDQYGKPVIFTEVGYRSVTNAHTQPWNYGLGGGYDPTEQSNDYQALMQFWNNIDFMSGIHMWDWKSDPNGGGQGNTDYTPQNKPAQNTIKTWFTQAPPPTSTTTPPTGTTTPPVQNKPGDWGVQASGNAAAVNQESSFSITVTNTGSVSNAIVDAEIYDSSNNRVHQQFFENQTISNTTPGNYTVRWTANQAGGYTLKLGVFSGGWAQNYYWNNNVLNFTVPIGPATGGSGGSGTTTPPTSTTTPPTSTTTPPTSTSTPPSTGGSFTTNIWWPTDGTSVTGVQPFKAMLEGKNISEYRMYWQVDGDRLNEMSDSQQGYPHKEALVDLSSWSWKGAGPYVINFVSKDMSGSTISQKSVNIYVR